MKSRVEALILNILGEQEELSPPLSRIEEILYSILNDTAYIKDPLSRIEAIVLAIKEKDEYTRNALSRIEEILKAILDGTNDYDKLPQSDIERDLIRFLGEWVTKTGDIVTFATDQVVPPFKRCEVELEPIQDLHGYDNPWPAGGGSNKFAIGDAIGVIPGASYGLTVTLDAISETIHIQGTPTWTASGSKTFRVVSFVSGNYFGNAPVTHDYSGMNGKWFILSKTNNISSINESTNPASDGTFGVGLSVTDVNPIDITMKLYVYEGSSAHTSWSPYSNLCPISGRSEVSVYVEETYDAQATPKATIQLGQTVYGGTVDATSGKLVIDKVAIDTTTIGYWQKSGSFPGGYFVQACTLGLKTNTPFICSHAKTATRLYDYLPGTCYCDSSINIRIMPGNSTLEDWESYRASQSALGTPVTVCGELATPVEVTLTPEEIHALLGNNCVWSDAGKITVTYHS